MSNNFIKFEKNKQVSNFKFVANVYNYSGSWFNEVCFIEKDDSSLFFYFFSFWGIFGSFFLSLNNDLIRQIKVSGLLKFNLYEWDLMWLLGGWFEFSFEIQVDWQAKRRRCRVNDRSRKFRLEPFDKLNSQKSEKRDVLAHES